MYTVAGVTNGVLRRLALHRNGKVVTVHVIKPGESEEAFRSRVARAIRREFEDDVRNIRNRVAFVDSPMHWLKGRDVETAGQPLRFPARYRFSAGRGAWQLPPELRDCRWPLATGAADARGAIELAVRGRRRNAQSSLEPTRED